MGHNTRTDLYNLNETCFTVLIITDSEAVHMTPKFVKDTSKFWYKPKITREEGKDNYKSCFLLFTLIPVMMDLVLRL